MSKLMEKLCNSVRKFFRGNRVEPDRGTEIAPGIWVDRGQPLPTFYPKEVRFHGLTFQQTGNDSFLYEIPCSRFDSTQRIGVRFEDLFEIGKKEFQWLQMVEKNITHILNTLISEWVNYAEGRQQEDLIHQAKNIVVSYMIEETDEFDSVEDMEWSISAEMDDYTFCVDMRALQSYGVGTVF